MILISDLFQLIKNKLFNVHDSAIKQYLSDENITHYLITYDLMEYNFKEIYKSFSISYFSKNNDLNEGMVDLDELRDYESVIKDTEDINQVLIKKFKLLFTAKKVNEFSSEIIISEIPDSDFNRLNHLNSLIKIAVVKDSVDDWFNSDELEIYDFIFTTSSDFVYDLKNINSNIFLLKGESVYFMFKNILNLLYTRRKEKFYYFINDRFQYVFPKVNNYFKIFHSEFFDENWYRVVYDIPDNTDPVFHYLMVGDSKGFNSGPYFDTWDYYELNKDVEVEDLNPLLHYELHGKSRAGSINFQMKKIKGNIQQFQITLF